MALHRAGDLAFFGDLEHLVQAGAFAAWLAPFRKSEWVVYSKPPFGGPEAVLAYLSRYTPSEWRSQTIASSAPMPTWWRSAGRTTAPKDGFHRIRHYGLLASGVRKSNLVKCRALLCDQPPEQASAQEVEPAEPEVTPLTLREPCPCCGGLMRIIEIFRRGHKPMSRAPPREQAA